MVTAHSSHPLPATQPVPGSARASTCTQAWRCGWRRRCWAGGRLQRHLSPRFTPLRACCATLATEPWLQRHVPHQLCNPHAQTSMCISTLTKGHACEAGEHALGVHPCRMHDHMGAIPQLHLPRVFQLLRHAPPAACPSQVCVGADDRRHVAADGAAADAERRRAAHARKGRGGPARQGPGRPAGACQVGFCAWVGWWALAAVLALSCWWGAEWCCDVMPTIC